jgi:hypothetical protein
MKKIPIIMTVLSFFIPACSDSTDKYTPQIALKRNMATQSEEVIIQKNKELDQLVNDHQKAKIDHIEKKRIFNAAKDAYDRASKNIDIMPREELDRFLKDYKDADQAYRDSEKKEQQLALKKDADKSELEGLKRRMRENEIGILEIMANKYDEEISQPVWAEGYGESVLGENQTIKECQKLALEYAKKDAIEKGGKLFVKTFTELEAMETMKKSYPDQKKESISFERVRESIMSGGNVQILSQDNSGEYGKPKQIVIGDVIKYSVTVRLKLQSVNQYNPFKEKIKELNTLVVANSQTENIDTLNARKGSMESKNQPLPKPTDNTGVRRPPQESYKNLQPAGVSKLDKLDEIIIALLCGHTLQGDQIYNNTHTQFIILFTQRKPYSLGDKNVSIDLNGKTIFGNAGNSYDFTGKIKKTMLSFHFLQPTGNGKAGFYRFDFAFDLDFADNQVLNGSWKCNNGTQGQAFIYLSSSKK